VAARTLALTYQSERARGGGASEALDAALAGLTESDPALAPGVAADLVDIGRLARLVRESAEASIRDEATRELERIEEHAAREAERVRREEAKIRADAARHAEKAEEEARCKYEHAPEAIERQWNAHYRASGGALVAQYLNLPAALEPIPSWVRDTALPGI
jgi:hypothetical protein